MPKRTDIESILLIGSGPIVIGQACEFDYSGTQACRVLRSEGYRVILANSNPATIMTDPDFADRTYVEPLTPDVLAAIIERENPDAVLPTLGGQTGLNLAMDLYHRGLVGVPGTPELIGANAKAIETAEDRGLFKQAMIEIGLKVPASGIAHTMDEARAVVAEMGLPIIIRPAYILGGRGTGIASTVEEFEVVASNGLHASPISEILIERSIAGWKEYELEVMRDRADNCVIICSIENFDPMGVHTGDSITVAPAQTLSDVEYQVMRDAAFACIRRVGVETGGSNVQFAVNPANGDQVVIEMNPRVSRSSALASKATGFPIAKIAARLAVGYTLDEIPNDITRATPASFEPSIDYVVTKVPRWAFEKLPGTSGVLGTQMQSVGEAMAIGRTFAESFQKGLRSLETGRLGLNADPVEKQWDALDDEALLAQAGIPTPDRPFQVEAALRRGISPERVHESTKIDPWFLHQMLEISGERTELEANGLAGMDRARWRRAKRLGFSDAQLGYLWGCSEPEVRTARLAAGVKATFKTVDTCAAEFAAETPYHYSTYEDTDEVRPSDKPRVIILGSGPNRIGQGIEFDYCCVHASFSLRDAGYETVMVNCNPETVSTDYDTSDRLYFEPLTREDVLNVIEAEAAAAGGVLPKVIVSLGGQTPLKLAGQLPVDLIAGTSPHSIDLAEDREKWNALCTDLRIPQPPGGTAVTLAEAEAIATEIGYPVLMRPSYVLGGRAMRIVEDHAELVDAMRELEGFGSLGKEGGLSQERPVLVDRFLADAIEVDVDAIRDHAGEVLIGGVMEHVEEAGVHSGDSACALPPQTLQPWVVEVIEAYTRSIAEALEVCGLINVQYAVRNNQVFVIEANPRASRTVPFVAKATGVPLVKVASRVMLGATLADLRVEGLLLPPVNHGHVAVKEAVLPFNRFPDVDTALGPEMRSTGEVMGIDATFGLAFNKAELAAGTVLPEGGTVFLSLADRHKPAGLIVARRLRELGFALAATAGTAEYLDRFGLAVDRVVPKVSDHTGDSAVELLHAGAIDFVINTPSGSGSRTDGESIRITASASRVGSVTTVEAALALVNGMAERVGTPFQVRSLQEYHAHEPAMTRAGRNHAPPAVPDAALATAVGGVELRSPVLLASGTAGHGAELAPYLTLANLGAVVVKSLLAEPWAGNPPPRVHPVTAGMLNAVGLQGPGVPAWRRDEPPPLLATDAVVVASIWGRTLDEYAAAAEALANLPASVVAVEVNLSCPNLKGKGMFAQSVDATRAAMAATAACGLPRWAKLTAAVTSLPDIAAAAAEGGAAAVTLVNTLPALALDVVRRRPVLGNGSGGLSGAAIHPVAVKAVWDVRSALGGLPIVGVGGIVRAEDAVELLLAGASAVQVGTATFADPRAAGRIQDDLARWCAAERTTVRELVGAAHHRPPST